MLAWVHVCCAGEREFLEGVFFGRGESVETEGKKSKKGRMVGSAWGGPGGVGEEDEEELWVRELMDLDLEKICVPLRVCILSGFLVL